MCRSERVYDPWTADFEPAAAKLYYCRDLLAIVKRHALRGGAMAPSR